MTVGGGLQNATRRLTRRLTDYSSAGSASLASLAIWRMTMS